MSQQTQAGRRFLTGADVILPGQVVSGRTVVIEGDRIVELRSGSITPGPGETRIDGTGLLVAPGFVDVHVHGAAGVDVLDDDEALAKVAGTLPRWGVTAFCPTTVACTPERLGRLCDGIARLRAALPPGHARVLPAHLESNFINPDFRGAQPLSCLRSPAAVVSAVLEGPAEDAEFSALDVLAAIDRHRPDVGIVTLASELAGGLALVRRLVASGVCVSLGHSGATFDEAQAAVAAGARHVTHLFNRMRPMAHREPGLAGAALASEELAAELICDGHHVHPAVMRVAIAAKGTSRVMAITDGTAGSGLPPGSKARLGGQLIVTGDVARLEDGTIAGSVLTMDRAFSTLVTRCGLALDQAAELCSTTPARELGLHGHGVLAAGGVADFVLLNAQLEVVSTWISGQPAWQVSSR